MHHGSLSLFIIILLAFVMLFVGFTLTLTTSSTIYSNEKTLSENINYSLTLPPGKYNIYVESQNPVSIIYSSCSSDGSLVFSRICSSDKLENLSIENRNDKPNNITIIVKRKSSLFEELFSKKFEIKEYYSSIKKSTSCSYNTDCNYDEACVAGTCISRDLKLCDDDHDCYIGYRCINSNCVSEKELKQCGDGFCSANEDFKKCPYDCPGMEIKNDTISYYLPYNGSYVVLNITLPYKEYLFWKNMERTYVGFIYSGNQTFLDISDYIQPNNKIIKELSYQLRTTDEAIKFVQNLNYEEDKLYTPFDEYPKYPLETLYEDGGDCEDTTILLASILSNFEEDYVLVYYPEHVALAIKTNGTGVYYEYNGSKYYYIETTSPGWKIGEIPDDFYGKKAVVVPIVKNNKSIYLSSVSCNEYVCELKGYSDNGRVIAGFNLDGDVETLYNYNSVVSSGYWTLTLYKPKCSSYRIVAWLENNNRKVAGPTYTKWYNN